MIEEIITFYTKELSFYSLVSKKKKWWQTALIYLLLITTFIFAGLYIVYQNSITIYLAAIFFITTLPLIIFFNALTIKRLYPHLYLSRFSWNSAAFNKMVIGKLKYQLNDMNLNDKKLDRIQSLISNKANEERVGSIVFISCTAGLFIPLWSAYLDQIMGQFTEIKELNILFIAFFMLIIEIGWLMTQLAELRDNIVTRYFKLKRVNDLISEVRLAE